MTDLEPRPESGGFAAVIAVSIVVGALAVGAALYGAPWSPSLQPGTARLADG